MAWQPITPLGHAVFAAGFEYDSAQDIIKSRYTAPVQTVGGFAWGIDVIGPAALMVLDCETFYFEYGGRMWLIELWKGQYGIETGCEIGVYHTVVANLAGEAPSETIKHVHRNHAMWFASSLDRPLLMSLTLTRDGSPFLHRGPEFHWWLTGFRWGKFSDRSQLTMDATIYFLDLGMRDQFVGAMKATGYSPRVAGVSVSFTFKHPHVAQPRSSIRGSAQDANRNLVDRYNTLKELWGISSNDPNEFVPPASWTDAIKHVAHQAVTTVMHSDAAAAAARLRAGATAAAATLQNMKATGVKGIEQRIDAAQSAYRDIMTFFQRSRWR